jgi:hypothetical protein
VAAFSHHHPNTFMMKATYSSIEIHQADCMDSTMALFAALPYATGWQGILHFLMRLSSGYESLVLIMLSRTSQTAINSSSRPGRPTTCNVIGWVFHISGSSAREDQATRISTRRRKSYLHNSQFFRSNGFALGWYVGSLRSSIVLILKSLTGMMTEG